MNDSALDASRESADPLLSSIESFLRWLEKEGCESYDPYDIWGTRYGLWARKIYYDRGKLGVPLVAPIILGEWFFPRLRSAFVEKKRYPTADAQLILGLLNLHALFPQRGYLAHAENIADGLLASSIPGFSGHCWGYPFAWRWNSGLWKKNTPFITATPYCFEAYLGLYEATGSKEYLEIAKSAARFIKNDLRDTRTGPDSAASSYSPFDNGKVFNASAYRAFVLVEASIRWKYDDWMTTAWRNINFLLEGQRADGSWLYALENESESFIDNFHTCFNLKNLFKINCHLKDSRIARALHRGYDYYCRELLAANGRPKSFSVVPRTQVARLEMYNFAEGITLGALLADEVPGAIDRAEFLAMDLIQNFQVRRGHFATRVFIGGIKHQVPFLRWPQAQLFYALTNLLNAKFDKAVSK